MHTQDKSPRRDSVSLVEVKKADGDLHPLLEELLPPEWRVAGHQLLRDLSKALEGLEMATAELRFALHTDDNGHHILSLRAELEVKQNCDFTRSEVFGTVLRDSSLDRKTSNVLARDNVYTVGDLLRRTEPELLQIRGFGNTMNREVQSFLKALGLKLRGA